MKVLWCWRCKADVTMLDEEEFGRVARLYGEPFKKRRESGASDKPPASLKVAFAPVCVEYERLTGFPETNANAVMHHRLSLYGPPCATCGKPLRTPQARHCAACGTPR
jgi:hypothetical protein